MLRVIIRNHIRPIQALQFARHQVIGGINDHRNPPGPCKAPHVLMMRQHRSISPREQRFGTPHPPGRPGSQHENPKTMAAIFHDLA